MFGLQKRRRLRCQTLHQRSDRIHTVGNVVGTRDFSFRGVNKFGEGYVHEPFLSFRGRR
jgi:hypothetical protein